MQLTNIFPFLKEKPLYEVIGEEEGIMLLVKNFYDIMENDSLARDCLMTHELDAGEVPLAVKNKLFMFLSGWFGGPNLFIENIGHPRMRARHSHVIITEKERDQWLYCMEKSLNKHRPRINNKNYKRLMNSFIALAYRIQNSEIQKP